MYMITNKDVLFCRTLNLRLRTERFTNIYQIKASYCRKNKKIKIKNLLIFMCILLMSVYHKGKRETASQL